MSTVRTPIPLLLALAACNQVPTGARVAILPGVPTTTDDLVVDFERRPSDADGDPLVTTIAWSVDGVDVPSLDGQPIVPADLTSRGERWAVRVSASDGRESGPDATAWVTIANAAPTAQVGIAAGGGLAGKPLEARALTSDADGDEVEVAWSWTVDGVDAGIATATVPGDLLARGQTWTVTVRPSDGAIEGAPASATTLVGNTAPAVVSVAITPDAPTAADALSATATTHDDDGDDVTVDFVWSRGDVAAATGPTVAAGTFTRGDVVTVVAVPSDAVSTGRGTATTVTIGNARPSATAAVLDPAIPVDGAPVACAGVGFTDPDDDPEGYDRTFSVNGAAVSAGTSLSSDRFAKGDTITCTLFPYDGLDTGAPVSVSAVVPNSAPSIAAVAIHPDVAYAGDVLSATVSGATDADDDAISYEYTWYLDGQVAGTTPTFSGFAQGGSVYVVVVPSDGEVDGAPVTSPSVPIANSPPSIVAARISPASAREADVLSCTGIGWNDADGDAPDYLVTWSVGDVLLGSPTLTGADFDRGDVVTCHLSPFDGREAGVLVSSDSVTIENTAPVLSGIALPPAPRPGETVEVTLGDAFDADGDAITYTYAWTIDDVDAGTGTTLTGFGGGSVLAVVVTPTDGIEDGPPVSRSVAVDVPNATPVITAVSITPSEAYAANTLTAGYVAHDDDEGDVLTATYAWTVNDTEAGTGATLEPGAFARGDRVAVVVTVTDGRAASEPFSSATTTVLNSAPVLAGVEIPLVLTEASTAACTPVGFTDDDDDAPDALYRWYVADELVSTGATLGGWAFDRGDAVWCEATPFDGIDVGVPATSATVVVSNAAPTLASATITPATPTVDATLSVDLGAASDPDGDGVSFAFAWTVNGEPAGTGATLAGSFSQGDVVQVAVTPTDGTTPGEAVTSPIVGIGGSTPVLHDVQLTSGALDTNSVAAVSVDASDADGDPLTIAYAWSVNGAEVGDNTPTLDGAVWFDRGDAVSVRVVVHDGTRTADPVTVGPVTVGNAVPARPDLSFTPYAPTDDDDLTCAIADVVVDADGDPVQYVYVVTRNGVELLAATTSALQVTVDAADTAAFDDFDCIVYATDGTDASAPATESVSLDPSWTFTTCGATGPTGPDETACDAAYVGTELDGAVSVVDGVQWFTTPATGTYRITGFGAQGGGDLGGQGAYASAVFELDAGETLAVIVGQRGGVSSQSPDAAAGGGGASWVFFDALDAEPLVVAAGGGGQAEGARGGAGSATTTPTEGAGTGSGTPGTGGVGGGGGHDVPGAWSFSTGGGGAGWLTDGESGLDLRAPAGAGGLAPRNSALGGLFVHGTWTGAHGGFGGGGSAADSTGAGGGGAGYNGGAGGNDYDGVAPWGSGGGGGSYAAPFRVADSYEAVTGASQQDGTVVITQIE